MKRSVKFLSLVLSAVIFVTAFTGVGNAAETENSLHYVTVNMPEACKNVKIADGVTQGINWSGAFKCIENGISAHKTVIDVSVFNIPYTDKNTETISNYLRYEPTVLKCLKDNSFTMGLVDEKICSIVIDYKYTEEEYAKMKAECEDVITQLLYGIKDNPSLTTAEKCLLVHDRLATWCEYDTDNLNNETIPNESFSAYGPLVRKIGVCEGISLAYGWMLDKMGIKNYLIASDLLGHSWNIVYIDDEAYFIDVTWDDPARDILGNSEHGNFLMPYSEFSKNHNKKGVTDYTNEPTSTTYVNACWTSSKTEVQVINGKLYYMDYKKYVPSDDAVYQTDDCKADLVCRDLKTGTNTVLFTVSDVWEGTSEDGWWPGNYSYITSIGNTLYYSTSKSIHAYNVDTAVDTVYYTPEETASRGTNIYGFTQKNGIFYIFVNSSPNINSADDGKIITKTVCSSHTDREKLSGLVEPTCVVPGTAKYICKDCRAIFTVTTSLGEHNYSVYVGVKEPASCTKNRIDIYKCATCTATTEKEIENTKTAHNYTEYVSEKEPATCMKNSIGIYKCATCDLTTEKEVPASKKEHTWDIYVGVKKAATCSNDRVDVYKCVNCTTTTEKVIANTKTKHSLQKVDAVEATATTTGNIEYYCCENCKAMFKDGNAQTAVTLKDVTIPATGKELLPGDVDNNGKVTSADARLALRASVGLEKYSDGCEQFILCDVDEDGKISAADARLILRASVGLEELKFKKSK